MFNCVEAYGFFYDCQVFTVVDLFPEWLNEVFALVFVYHDTKNLVKKVTSANLAAAWTRVDEC